MIYAAFSEFVYAYQNITDVIAVVEVVVPVIAILLMLIKFSTYWYYHDEIFSMIDEIKELNEKFYPQKYSQIIKSANALDQRISGTYLKSCLFSGILYYTSPIIKDIALYWFLDSQRSFDMPMKATFFYDITKTPAYELTYLTFTICIIMIGTTHGTVNGIFIGSALNICAHFDILREIINECEMKEFIEYHKKVLSLAAKLNKLYQLTIMGEYFMQSLVACVTAFQIVFVTDPAILIPGIISGICALIEILFYSYGGQLIMDKSMDVCKEVYKVDKNYLFIMMRSNREVKIKAGFFHASLPTFTTIVNSAGSMMALLKSLI